MPISKPRPPSRCAALALVSGLAAGLASAAAAAQESVAPAATVSAEPGFTTGLFASSRANLFGDMGGLRSALGTLGLSFGLSETSEVLGNVSGGVHRGADYDGLTILSLGLDTQKAFGWEGGTFNISALQIHGRDLATDNLYSLQTPSGIEASRATRLWELWYQQAFLEGRLDVKLGQQSIDQEFVASQYSGLFMNTMMGWPLLPSVDLYAGGPAYPLSSLGARVRGQPLSNVTVLAGVFDDNPPGGPFDDDDQTRGAEQSGTGFNTGTGALIIAEVQYALNQPATGDMVVPGAPPPGLPGTYKLGAWYDTARFPDQRIDSAGLSLADPASTGIPRNDAGNFGIYGVVDQMLWRPDPQSPRSVGVFARLIGAPGDRNLIGLSVNAGFSLKAPLAGRDNDTAGLGFGLGQVGSAVTRFDREAIAYGGTPGLVRRRETFIEATYQMQIAPWWQLQPDIQYVFSPGAGIANPDAPPKRVGNETILGLRTNITF